MTILLTNDDGYDADGICYLKNEIKKIEQTVTFAPRQNCSGYSAAISLGKDIDVEELNKDTFIISVKSLNLFFLSFTSLSLTKVWSKKFVMIWFEFKKIFIMFLSKFISLTILLEVDLIFLK